MWLESVEYTIPKPYATQFSAVTELNIGVTIPPDFMKFGRFHNERPLAMEWECLCLTSIVSMILAEKKRNSFNFKLCGVLIR